MFILNIAYLRYRKPVRHIKAELSPGIVTQFDIIPILLYSGDQYLVSESN